MFYRMLSCGFTCEVPEEITSEEFNVITQMKFYDIHVKSNDDVQRFIYRHSISSPQIQVHKRDRSKVLINDPFFDKMIRKVTDRQLFFPAPNLYMFECDTNSSDITCHFGKHAKFLLDDSLNSTNELHTDVKRFLFTVERNKQLDNNSTIAVQNEGFDGRTFWVRGLSLDNDIGNDKKEYGLSCNEHYFEVVIFF